MDNCGRRTAVSGRATRSRSFAAQLVSCSESSLVRERSSSRFRTVNPPTSRVYASLGISAHFDTVETVLAERTRLLDYGLGLPIVEVAQPLVELIEADRPRRPRTTRVSSLLAEYARLRGQLALRRLPVGRSHRGRVSS